MQGLDQQAVAGLQGDVVQVSEIGQAVADRRLARREALTQAQGQDFAAHGRYEFPRQKLKLGTRGQVRSRVIQRSKNRGSRRQPR